MAENNRLAVCVEVAELVGVEPGNFFIGQEVVFFIVHFVRDASGHEFAQCFDDIDVLPASNKGT